MLAAVACSFGKLARPGLVRLKLALATELQEEEKESKGNIDDTYQFDHLATLPGNQRRLLVILKAPIHQP